MARSRLVLYDNGGTLVDEIYVRGPLELSYQHGRPHRLQVPLARGSDIVDLRRLYPNGEAAYIEYADEGAYGLPTWLGQVEGLDQGSESGGRQLVANGPQQWLGDELVASLPAGLPVEQSGAAVLIEAIQQLQTSVDLRIEALQTEHVGEALEDRVVGGTVWSLIDKLEQERDEEVYLNAVAGACQLRLRVLPALGSRDRTDIELNDKVNCRWTGSITLAGTVSELAGIGRGYDTANLVRGYAARAVRGKVLGLRSALAAEIAGRTINVREVTSGRTINATSPTAAANRARTIATLRRSLPPQYRAQVTITDDSLWSELQTRDLVSTRWYEDDTGVYTEGVAKIRTLQYSIGDSLKCVGSVDLWETVVTL